MDTVFSNIGKETNVYAYLAGQSTRLRRNNIVRLANILSQIRHNVTDFPAPNR